LVRQFAHAADALDVGDVEVDVPGAGAPEALRFGVVGAQNDERQVWQLPGDSCQAGELHRRDFGQGMVQAFVLYAHHYLHGQ